jgi:hypothetical protein
VGDDALDLDLVMVSACIFKQLDAGEGFRVLNQFEQAEKLQMI